jgi:Glycoside hydrolase family 44
MLSSRVEGSFGLCRAQSRGRLSLLIAAFAIACAEPAVAGAATGPTLTVNAAAERHAISPDIYGMNFAEPELAREIDLPVDRWGGDATETYNYKIGADNTSEDYFYENVADCWSEAREYCRGEPTNKVFAYRELIDKDRALGATTLLTLPLMGYVANDAPTSHPFTCSFPASVYPEQESFDPYDANCGNGIENGKHLPSDPTRAGMAIGPGFDQEWVKQLVGEYGTAADGGVGIYELGNEPALWDQTHRDMHPQPTTYDELWEKSRELAIAVKQADPSAQILGFSEWGWPNYFCSAADDVENGCSASSPDRAAHGGTPLVNWYLQQMAAYEGEHGTRLLDYIDVHYYAQGGENTEVTRSLWDPTYTDPSWIDTQIDLIPRMRQWVAEDYPGTKISLSEYNLSVSKNPVVNALIQADTLGIFAREGLDLATRWSLPIDGPDIPDAFLMYRDYDGAHGQFGDTWVQSQSTDQSKLAVYGAERSSDGAYTVMVINKTAQALTSPLELSGFTPAGAAQVWQWTGGAIAHQPDAAISGDQITATYPPESLTMYAIDNPNGGQQVGGEPVAPGQEGEPQTSAPPGAPFTAPANLVPPLPSVIASPPSLAPGGAPVRFALRAGPRVRLRGARGHVDSGLLVGCPTAAQPCAITLTARAETEGAPAGRARGGAHAVLVASTGPISIPAGTSSRLDFLLDRRGVSALRQLGRMRVQLVVRVVQAGTPSVWRGTLELLSPRR